MILILGMGPSGLKVSTVYINNDPELTVTHFMATEGQVWSKLHTVLIPGPRVR